MAESERRSNAGTAALAGGGAALGVALALLLSGKAKAAPEDTTLALLQSIAESGVSVDTDTSDIIDILNQIATRLGAPSGGGGVGLGNPSEITTFQTTVPVAFANPQQLPDRLIPPGMELVIKALPGTLGQIWVANSRAEAMNANSVYILIANEAIEYKIKNASQIWINATRAGEGVCCTAEKVGL